MPIARNVVDPEGFNHELELPFQLRIDDFRLALTDVYDFFYDVNEHLTARGLQRLDDMLRPAIMSGVLSDMLTSSLARHSDAGGKPVFQRASRPSGSGGVSRQFGSSG